MRSVWILVGSLPLWAAGCTEPSPEREPVGCTIKGNPTCELGKAPEITVALTNQSDAAIYLVGSLDASGCKWRYPHCSFEIIRPDGKPAVGETRRCGNMNTLRIKD